jgi:hypothetical protein
VKVIKIILENNSEIAEDIKKEIRLTNLIANQNYFQFNAIIYKQTEGLGTVYVHRRYSLKYFFSY